MSNQRNLKAFVRYDGSGRVVAGSLVLRKKKPKVGRWEEILTYECCGDSPTTTTTTSTFSTTTTTTTAYYYNADYNIGLACGAVGQFNLPLTIAPDVCTSGNIVLNSGTYADYGIPNNSMIYINLNNGNVIQVQTFGSNIMSFGCTSCSGTTTTTTTVVTPSFFYLVSDTTDSTNACNLIGETTYMTLAAVESDINNITVLYESPSSGVFIPFVGNGDKYLVAVPGGGPNPPTNYTSMNINNNGFVSNKSTC